MGATSVYRISEGVEGEGGRRMGWLDAGLVRDERIGTVGVSDAVGRWAADRLGRWDGDEEENEGGRELLCDILILSPFIPRAYLTAQLVRIISSLLGGAPRTPERECNPEETSAALQVEYGRTPANTTWVLGKCLYALARTAHTPSSSSTKTHTRTKSKTNEETTAADDGWLAGANIDLRKWINAVVGTWAWSAWVMGGLVDVVRAR